MGLRLLALDIIAVLVWPLAVSIYRTPPGTNRAKAGGIVGDSVDTATRPMKDARDVSQFAHNRRTHGTRARAR